MNARVWWRAPELSELVNRYANGRNVRRKRPPFFGSIHLTTAQAARELLCSIEVVEYLLSIEKLYELGHGTPGAGIPGWAVLRLEQSLRLLARNGSLDHTNWPLHPNKNKEVVDSSTAKLARIGKYSPEELMTKMEAGRVLQLKKRRIEYLMTENKLKRVELGHRTVFLTRSSVFRLQRFRERHGRKLGPRLPLFSKNILTSNARIEAQIVSS